jgi:hypothetical protein
MTDTIHAPSAAPLVTPEAASWATLRQGYRDSAPSYLETSSIAASTGTTYLERTGPMWVRGALLLMVGLPGFFTAIQYLALADTTIAFSVAAFGAAMSVCTIWFGAWLWFHAWRRDLGLTVTESGVKQTTILGTRWAEWKGLGPFEIDLARRSRAVYASAGIEGRAVSRNLRDKVMFRVPDHHATPIMAMVEELNAWRTHAIGARSTPRTPIRKAPIQKIRDMPVVTAADLRPALICAVIGGLWLGWVYLGAS